MKKLDFSLQIKKHTSFSRVCLILFARCFEPRVQELMSSIYHKDRHLKSSLLMHQSNLRFERSESFENSGFRYREFGHWPKTPGWLGK